MSDNKYIITNQNILDAFYSIPDFTDDEGNHLGGIYGTVFKLITDLKSGAYTEVATNLDADSENNASVKWQISRFEEIWNELDKVSTGNLIAALEAALVKVSPFGETKNIPVFSLKMSSTSDLNEVEALFDKALKYGKTSPENYVAFYPLCDNNKARDIIGVALCHGEEAVYIVLENFITPDDIGKKLKALSKEVSLVTFGIKDSYRLFTPYEISDRDHGYNYNEEDALNEVIFSTDNAYKTSPRMIDVLLGAYLLNPLKNDYEPWDIAKEYCKLNLEKKADLFGKESLLNADEKIVREYACKIAYVCFMSAPLIRKKLSKEGMENLFYNIEMPLSYILFDMEKEGIIAKRDELKAYGDKLAVRIKELEKIIYEAAGCEFNINSPKQLGEILFERMGLPAEKKTKSGYSTAADVLEKLAPEHKVVADILEYRGLAKLKSTYADGLTAFIEDDGRIHTSFNQTITATGRISSTEPNLQNIPMRTELGRLIRKVFVPKEGYVFADADYSQIELRILAHMSQDKGLIEAYHEGDDIHRITASKVFHVPFEDVTPLQRRNAKAVNFGIVYGISSYGLSQDLDISAHEAKEYMDKYFETYPGVKEYQDRVIAQAKAKGFSITMYGRRRPIPELKAGNYNLRQFGERVAMNAPIQGTAADIIKIAMINVFFRLKKENLKSKLILQIHDELVIETAPDEVDVVTALLTSEMEKAVKLSVPMEAECHTGSDWYEAK